MRAPLVSIILPAYNSKSKRLKESIDSVLSQTYTHRELIIINDASTNDIATTILAFQQKDERIKYVMNEKNLGLTQTLNRGIALSQGKYIARIDDDDIWCDKDKLKKQVEFMETNPEYGLCGTSVIQINEEGKEITKTDVPTDNDQIKKTLMRFNQFAHASVIFRRDIVSHVGVYNPDYNGAEDYEYWMRIGTMYKLANLPDYCLKYRHNTHGVSSKKKYKQWWLGLKAAFLYRKYYPHFWLYVIPRLCIILFPRKVLSFLLMQWIKK